MKPGATVSCPADRLPSSANGRVTQPAAHLAAAIGMRHRSIVTGEELDKYTTPALFARAPKTDLFVEINPNEKERIIRALRKESRRRLSRDGINKGLVCSDGGDLEAAAFQCESYGVPESGASTAMVQHSPLALVSLVRILSAIPSKVSTAQSKASISRNRWALE
jgi:hypothetical protein